MNCRTVESSNLRIVAAVAALLAAGCCSFVTCDHTSYPEVVDEGFVELFDGETLLSWDGDTALFSTEKNPVGYHERKWDHVKNCEYWKDWISDGTALVYIG